MHELIVCVFYPLLQHQNTLLRQLIETEFPGVLLIDVEVLSALRPDAHRGAGDCLHWGNRHAQWRRREEVTEAPHILLLNAIEWLQRWDASHSPKFPAKTGTMPIPAAALKTHGGVQRASSRHSVLPARRKRNPASASGVARDREP